MAAWKPYNVSGTIHVGDDINDLFCTALEVLQTEEIAVIGHYTGATTVGGRSQRAWFQSTGFDLHEFHALVAGERDQWLAFAADLEACLDRQGLPYNVTVHEKIVNVPPEGDRASH
jgi:hypothetical protein